MESNTARHENQLALTADDAAKKQQLITFLTEHTAPLLGTLRSYVQRMGLATGDEVPSVALEVLQEQDIEADEQTSSLLSLVSAEDQRILRLAFLYDCEREALAKQLGITPAAARVRLHRALSRLRIAWHRWTNRKERANE